MPELLAEDINAPGTANDRTVRYLYGPGGVTSDITTMTSGGAETLRWYHLDQLGSTVSLTNVAGATIATRSSTRHTVRRTRQQFPTPLGWAGEYRDAETGLVYLRARYYDPSTGQFLTRDPSRP